MVAATLPRQTVEVRSVQSAVSYTAQRFHLNPVKMWQYHEHGKKSPDLATLPCWPAGTQQYCTLISACRGLGETLGEMR